MSDDLANSPTVLMAMTADIVAAYIGRNDIDRAAIPGLIATVHASLSTLDSSSEPAFEKQSPQAVKRSVRPDGLVSFLDGKVYKTLKRHLASNGFTPESYRAKFGLPTNYPMVAANYSAERTALAKTLGLGRMRTKVPTPAPKHVAHKRSA